MALLGLLVIACGQSRESHAATCSDGVTFEEVGGILTMEMEYFPVDTTKGWKLRYSDSAFNQGYYLAYEGPASMGSFGAGLAEVTLGITEPGDYRLRWLQRSGEGASTSEANDTWVAFPGADDYFAVKGTDTVRPATVGQGGAFKIYGHSLEFKWMGSTKDNDAHDIYVRFKNPGTYKMQIAGRSPHHHIDRAVLYNDPNDKSIAESTTRAHNYCGTPPVMPGSSSSGSSMNPAIALADTEAGLTCDLYTGAWTSLPDFSAFTPTATGRCSQVQLTDLNHPADGFGAVFSGFINIPLDATWTFEIDSNDGSQLLLDDKPLITYDGTHGLGSPKSGSVALAAGYHKITVRYFEGANSQDLLLKWSATGHAQEEVPASALVTGAITGVAVLPATAKLVRMLVKSPDYDLLGRSLSSGNR